MKMSEFKYKNLRKSIKMSEFKYKNLRKSIKMSEFKYKNLRKSMKISMELALNDLGTQGPLRSSYPDSVIERGIRAVKNKDREGGWAAIIPVSSQLKTLISVQSSPDVRMQL